MQLWARRDSNSLPPAPERRTGGQQGLAGDSKDAESLRSDEGGSGSVLDQEAAFGRSFGPTLVQGSRLLTVREVAVVLRVCTATVYRLCAQGVLQHVRISNAVRVPADAVERHLRAGAR
jgi:excisionase family DNA binding protein